MAIQQCVRSPIYSKRELYRRIDSSANPNLSIVPILDQWGKEGGCLDLEVLESLFRKFLYSKRYQPALEISTWMSNKRCYPLTTYDVAVRLRLISKVQGLEQAERYFNNLREELKDLKVYGSLLQCYVPVECVEKGDAIMQRIWERGFYMMAKDCHPMPTLHEKTRNLKKLEALLQEMEEKGIVRDDTTLDIILSQYAAVRDVEGMDKELIISQDPQVVLEWTNDTVPAKAGVPEDPDKALEMLKKAEERLRKKGDAIAYNSLVQYANFARRSEVLRIWSLYEKHKICNNGYSHFMNSLVTLGDFEMAEKIFNEWESRDGLAYDMNIPNIMIGAYSKKGLIEKAEAFIDRAISNGGKPNAWTWYHLVEGYFKNEQPQKAVEMMKKTIVMLSGTEWEPVPDVLTLKKCVKYLKGVGDTEHTYEFVKLLLDKEIISLDKLEEQFLIVLIVCNVK